MNRSARHKARVLALQSLYEWMIAQNSVEFIENHALVFNAEKTIDTGLFQQLFRGVVAEQSSLDSYFLPYLDRPVSQLTPIELCILRLAVFELLHFLDIPYPIVIDEAVRLTKEFGATTGFKYINAILDQVAKKIRAGEK